MKRKTGFLLILLLALTMFSCKIREEQLERLDVVKNVDLQKYKGTWYEIARFPNRFEKDLVGVTATYSIRENGKIGVLNKGYKDSLDGKLKEARGFAKIPYPEWSGYLQVYFFWPFGGDYLILDLDKKDYNYVLIGSASKKYLWVLSRTPEIDREIYERLVNKAKDLGFDISKLKKTPQKK